MCAKKSLRLDSVGPGEGEGPAKADGHFDEHGQFVRRRGLNWVITGLFLVGDIAGGGLVALPTAMIQSQFWPGIFGVLLLTLVTGYTSYLLGRSWMLLVRRWPEYRAHTRKPYPEIGFRACGPRMRVFVSVCIDITQFGVACVYLLLAAQNIHSFVQTFFATELSYCYVILAVALALLPVTFLKSPQDFWPAVVLAMFTTAAAVVLILVGTGMDWSTCRPLQRMPGFKLTNYFLALGTLIFSYGGHAAFPTIQHDMKRPAEFTKATLLAFAATAGLYLPVCVLAYLVYGDSLRDSVISSLQTQWVQRSVNMLITVHCILTTTIVVNPLNQEAEEFFRVPQEFSLKRVFVRAGTMAVLVFVAESVPNFGPLLDLVGGSTLTMTSIILPCVFWLFLNGAEQRRIAEGRPDDQLELDRIGWREALHRADRVTLGICGFIMVFGVLGGLAATFSAAHAMAGTQLVTPCYLQPFLGNGALEKSPLYCCGPHGNVSASPDLVCGKSEPFY